MSDIDTNEIRRLDGALLLVFRELIRRGRTTAAAAHLGLSQSAISHALSRLRDIFGDPLFLRRPHGLEPTARAQELAPRIEALIEQMGAALRPQPRYDPARSSRWFGVSGTEFVHGVVGPALVRRMREATRVGGFTFQFLRGYRALDALRRGQIDLALGRFEGLPFGFAAEDLYEDRYCVVARKGHPDIQGRVETEQWRRTGHVFVGSLSPSDEVLGPAVGEDPLPRPGDVATTAIVPRWEMALEMVAGSDAIATGPRRLAEAEAARLGLQVLDPPLPTPPPWTVVMAYRDAPDPGLAWFRDQVQAVLA
ncbi:MAG TPA: LysR family transcriptional regulator [Caulobacteraceae bacterium]|nr:LysR family transcriptional regulator [Caulobacteraceae bacterium]